MDVLEGALLIAQAEYPGLDRDECRRRIDEMSWEARELLARSRGALPEELAELSRLFSARWGFRGNREDYYDPRNSFLNDVLERRTGIPITLSLVYIEVGRRAGLDLVGVGMPGHFLVGCRARPDLYVDAYAGGALLTRVDCISRLRELRPDVAFRPEFLAPVGPRLILIRMLNNLQEIYLHGERYRKALVMLDMIFSLDSKEPEWLRRRALVHYRLKNYLLAIADLEDYLSRAEDAPDREQLVQQLAALHHLRGRVN